MMMPYRWRQARYPQGTWGCIRTRVKRYGVSQHPRSSGHGKRGTVTLTIVCGRLAGTCQPQAQAMILLESARLGSGSLSPDVARVINVDQLAGADRRLYGVMQHLMAAYAQQQAPERPDPRGVVELQDVLDAVIQLAAVIDEETQAGRIPTDRGQHAAAMLMLVREYIQPLPRGLDADGVTDNLTTDLCAMVMALREARQTIGYKG
jgi:hypothetical protein